MTFFQGMGQLLGQVWSSLGGIQIPFMNISVSGMIMGIFGLTIAVGIIRRLFQGAVELKSINKDTEYKDSNSRYGKSEKRKGAKINKKRSADEL